MDTWDSRAALVITETSLDRSWSLRGVFQLRQLMEIHQRWYEAIISTRHWFRNQLLKFNWPSLFYGRFQWDVKKKPNGSRGKLTQDWVDAKKLLSTRQLMQNKWHKIALSYLMRLYLKLPNVCLLRDMVNLTES